MDPNRIIPIRKNIVMAMRNTMIVCRFKFVSIILVSSILICSTAPPFIGAAGSSLSHLDLQLDAMTPEEKVGQLFLLTFNGSDTSAAAPVFDLIKNYHIGGVILDRDNGNFTDPDQIPYDCWNLVRGLQLIEFNSSNLSSSDDPIF